MAFACPDHVDDLIAARPLHDRDRAEQARRRRGNEQQVGDLAVGREARELVERARRWAAAHPELTYRRPPVDAYASRDGGVEPDGGTGAQDGRPGGQQGR